MRDDVTVSKARSNPNALFILAETLRSIECTDLPAHHLHRADKDLQVHRVRPRFVMCFLVFYVFLWNSEELEQVFFELWVLQCAVVIFASASLSMNPKGFFFCSMPENHFQHLSGRALSMGHVHVGHVQLWL